MYVDNGYLGIVVSHDEWTMRFSGYKKTPNLQRYNNNKLKSPNVLDKGHPAIAMTPIYAMTTSKGRWTAQVESDGRIPRGSMTNHCPTTLNEPRSLILLPTTAASKILSSSVPQTRCRMAVAPVTPVRSCMIVTAVATQPILPG